MIKILSLQDATKLIHGMSMPIIAFTEWMGGYQYLQLMQHIDKSRLDSCPRVNKSTRHSKLRKKYASMCSTSQYQIGTKHKHPLQRARSELHISLTHVHEEFFVQPQASPQQHTAIFQMYMRLRFLSPSPSTRLWIHHGSQSLLYDNFIIQYNH